jgi:hypothetical protein
MASDALPMVVVRLHSQGTFAMSQTLHIWRAWIFRYSPVLWRARRHRAGPLRVLACPANEVQTDMHKEIATLCNYIPSALHGSSGYALSASH